MDDTFGKRLKLLRKIKNKQQKEVALDLNLSKGTYSLYESDLRMPGIKTLIKLADYYNVTVDFLLGREVLKCLDAEKLFNDLDELIEHTLSIQNYIKNF